MNDDTKSVENLTNENIDESAENTAGNAENPDVKTEKISESVSEKQFCAFVPFVCNFNVIAFHACV